MKKIFLLSIIALASLRGVFAEGITITKDATDYTNGSFSAWFDISDFPGNNAFTLNGFIIKNTSTTPKTIRMIRQEVSVLPLTENYFCWTACYSPTTDTSEVIDNLVMAPDAVFTGVFLDYKPSGQLGESLIRYIFQNVADLNDTASILVRYNASATSIKEISSTAKLNALFPNPANNNVTVNYAVNQGSASLEIKNLLGQVQRVTPIVAGSKSANLPIADLPSGIYFVSLKSNGNIIDTKRLVVN
jgi:hypothetical protein